MDVDSIRDALATALDTISGLRVAPFFGSNVVPPAAAIPLPDIEYDSLKGNGGHHLMWSIWLVVGRPTDRSAEARLAEYLSTGNASSVIDAIESDPTLGGACATCSVLTAEIETITIGQVDYLAAFFTIDLYAN